MSVTLRWIAGARITGASPCIAVSETHDTVALYQPPGTLWRKARGIRGGPRNRNLVPGGHDGTHDLVEWSGDGVLRLYRFGEPWSVWRWLSPNREWLPQFYVNLEDPWRRTSIGFDTGDWILDVVVGPDGQWRYKDEDELEWAEEVHLVDREWVDRARNAGRAAVARIEANKWPFNADWDQWLPDAHLPLPQLPSDWPLTFEPGTGA